MIRINASYSKKVPAEQAFSSRSAAASVEVELSENDAGDLKAKLHGLWASLKEAVESELNGGGNGHAPSNGNGYHQQVPPNARPENDNGASKKQLGYILKLAEKRFGHTPAEVKAWLHKQFKLDFEKLSKFTASQVIEVLKAYKAIPATLPALKRA